MGIIENSTKKETVSFFYYSWPNISDVFFIILNRAFYLGEVSKHDQASKGKLTGSQCFAIALSDHFIMHQQDAVGAYIWASMY